MSSRRLRPIPLLVLLVALLAASGCRELLGPSPEAALPEPDSSLESDTLDGEPLDEPLPMVPVPPRHGVLDAKKKNLARPELAL
ncbi:MAG: hypothetical protein ACT4PE_10935 [Candidatus Eiseniibacteriota bacterium]